MPSSFRIPISTTCASKIVADPVADEVVHRLHLEVLREPRWTLVDQRELGVALAGLLEQPGVLERHAQAPCDRRQQPDVAVAERVLTIEVLEGDDAGPSAADDQRDEDRQTVTALRRSRTDSPPRCTGVPCRSLTTTGSARVERDLAEPHHRHRMVEQALAALERIREPDPIRGLVDACRCRPFCASKISWIRSPTRSYIACGSRFSTRPRWTSLISASSALRCRVSSNKPRVLERDAQAAGERRQQPNVRLAERVLAIQVLERDDARRLRRRPPAARTPPTWLAPLGSTGGAAQLDDPLGEPSLNTSGSRVSRTFLRRPPTSIGSSSRRERRARSCTGKRISPASSSRMPMSTTWRRRCRGSGPRRGRTSPASRGSSRDLAGRR